MLYYNKMYVLQNGWYWRKYITIDNIIREFICEVSVMDNEQFDSPSINEEYIKDSLVYAGPIPKPSDNIIYEIDGIDVPYIKVFVQNDEELIILHNNNDSLLKFTLPKTYTNDQIRDITKASLSEYDWNITFEEAYYTEKYRKAVLSIPNKLINLEN